MEMLEWECSKAVVVVTGIEVVVVDIVAMVEMVVEGIISEIIIVSITKTSSMIGILGGRKETEGAMDEESFVLQNF